MRLWSIHPKYLDTKGLVALWRESLLAQKCLIELSEGNAIGYSNHSQLQRFKAHDEEAINIMCSYLYHVFVEAKNRGFKFNYMKIKRNFSMVKLPVNLGQVLFEFKWLQRKLYTRCRPQFVMNKMEDVNPYYNY